MHYETLKKRPQFLEMRKKGKTFPVHSFIISMHKEASSDNSSEKNSENSRSHECVKPRERVKSREWVKVGYIVTKKMGNAVVRNKSKRRMRAVMDKLIRLNENFLLPKGYDGLTLVLIGRKFSVNGSFEKMLNETRKILKEQGCTI